MGWFMGGLGGAIRDDFVVEPGGEHVGEKQGAGFDIEGNRCGEKGMIHAVSSECIAPGSPLAIDVADLVQNLTEPLIVGQIFCGLATKALGNVVHLRSLPVVTDREIVFWAVTGAASAFAAWLATRFVALDKRTTE